MGATVNCFLRVPFLILKGRQETLRFGISQVPRKYFRTIIKALENFVGWAGFEKFPNQPLTVRC
jgi:hypothetical protein